MPRRPLLLSLALATAATAFVLPLAAQADEAEQAAVDARQSLMTLFSHNLGPLALMAQGRLDYDAATAQAAADNLYHLTRHTQDRLWPAGTAHGEFPDSAARAAIWENLEEFSNRYAALQQAAEAMQGAAGGGLQALQGALAGLGGACRGCHEQFRVAD